MVEWKKSALSDCRHVFHFLKRRHLPPGRSVTCNSNEKPIGNPHDAFTFAKRQWDEIFSVNAHGVAHQPVDDIVAPYIRDPFGCVLPDSTACHLFGAIQCRRDDAVGSFDGWRTVELKALPPQAFQPLVKLWTKVEQALSQGLLLDTFPTERKHKLFKKRLHRFERSVLLRWVEADLDRISGMMLPQKALLQPLRQQPFSNVEISRGLQHDLGKF